ncbi:endoplasmic reticulum metallopeptidase 1-like isoform X2 [Battus philenor]|uniref:endoplasmic reticulum metallopeptidase 1-like isoform X2 n=1 Tax=Battus philenor TaxID=42288 RepID=UPI0035CFFC5F
MDIEEYNSYSRKRTNEFMNLRAEGASLPTFHIEEERVEKPWQKMFYQNKKKRSLLEPTKPVPSIGLLLILGAYLTLGYLTQLIEDDMPKVVNELDIQTDDTDTFSEEAAKKFLHEILGGAPRVAGTEFHYEKTQDLKTLLDSIAEQANLPVKTDWQFVSGDYWIKFNIAYVNCYQNLSNIVAILEGESGFKPNGETGTSLLVNCHHDSVPFAIGASDNGVFCAVMLETLSKLSRRKKKLKHNVVFLFNGAEENPLQGSHGFLQHPWFKGVTNVINLDAAGMNGKPAVFQVTDPRLMSAYQRVVPRPNAQSFGEFLFRSGLIPSDTDFRIWRDFGDIHGIDIAFTKWGTVYHTRNDRPELIKDGVVQNAGNLLLGLVKTLADTEELETKVPPSQVVYYDFLNLFVISYGATVSQQVDAAVAVFALITVVYYLSLVGFRRSSLINLLSSIGGRVLSAVVGIAVVVFVVLVLAATTPQLRYLSRPWLVVPLYWIPYLMISMLTSIIYDSNTKCGLNRSLRTLQAMSSTRLLLGLSLLILSFVSGLASLRYILTVPLFLMSIGSLVSITAVRYFRLTGWQHLALECALSLPSVMFYMSMALRLDAIMVPTAGRTPANYPDYIVGGLNLLLAFLVSITVSGIELLFSRKRLWLPMGLVAASCVVLMYVPVTIYEDDGVVTQRHSWFHSEIITYDMKMTVVNRTTGVLVTRQDAHTLKDVKAALVDRNVVVNYTSDLTADCRDHVFCNLPMYRPRHDALFLYTEPPARFEPEPSLNATRSCAGDVCTLSCIMIGTAHNTLTFHPQPGVELVAWSLAAPVKASQHHQDRPIYLITHSVATYSQPLPPYHFTLTLKVNETHQAGAILEVSHHAHLISHPQLFTEGYRSLLAAMPSHAHIASTISIRSNYLF